MNKPTIYGELDFNGNEYPFILHDNVLSIVQAPGHYSSDFDGIDKAGFLHGVTSANQDIIFLDCTQIETNQIGSHSQIRFSLYGYVIQRTQADCYDRLVFFSSALNAFYTPRRAWNMQGGDVYSLPDTINLDTTTNSTTNFTAHFPDEDIECSLGFYFNFNLKEVESTPLSIRTEFSMTFSTPRKSNDIGKYYLYIRDFLSFLNFENDIPIDEISLSVRDHDKMRPIGKATIFQNDCSSFHPDTLSSILLKDIEIEVLPQLFVEIASMRVQDSYNPFFIPQNHHERTTTDRARWLIAAIAFEGEFNKQYKNQKFESNSNFRKAKAEFLETTDISRFSHLNSHQRRYWKNFRRLIELSDMTIKEKFQFCLNHFKEEIEGLIPRFCSHANTSTETDYAEEYSKARNFTAHGVVTPISDVDCVTLRLLHCFIYLLIMERAGVAPKSRKNIIYKLF